MADQIIPDSLPEGVLDAVAEALGDAYDCTRVWSAWSCGTMGPDDFEPVAEDGERVADIARAAITAWEACNLQASLNEQFGIPEELLTAIRGFIAASWMPSKEESTEEMRVTYSYWHKRLVKAVGAMGYVEAEEIAMQPTKGEGE